MPNDLRRRDWTVVDGVLQSLGYAQHTVVSSAISLNAAPAVGNVLPSDARLMLVVVTGQAVRWRSDGWDPTATEGMPLAVDTPFWFNGSLDGFRIIETAASAVVNVEFFT